MTAVRMPGLVSCVRGATAVEFAMVLAPFVLFLLGIISAAVAVYAELSLQYAVEAAARCYSADTGQYSTATQCTSATSTQSYAKTVYLGTGSPTFTASTAACGHQVSATLNVVLNAGIKQWTVPLSATACFP